MAVPHGHARANRWDSFPYTVFYGKPVKQGSSHLVFLRLRSYTGVEAVSGVVVECSGQALARAGPVGLHRARFERVNSDETLFIIRLYKGLPRQLTSDWLAFPLVSDYSFIMYVTVLRLLVPNRRLADSACFEAVVSHVQPAPCVHHV